MAVRRACTPNLVAAVCLPPWATEGPTSNRSRSRRSSRRGLPVTARRPQVGAENFRTGKIMAEKVIRYMEEKLRQKDANIEKLKLKNATIKSQVPTAPPPRAPPSRLLLPLADLPHAACVRLRFPNVCGAGLVRPERQATAARRARH